MTSKSLELSNPKGTSQSAFLEGTLTRMRTRQVRPHIHNKRILDFGCGEHLTTLRNLRTNALDVAGYDILFQGLPPQLSYDGIPIYGNLDQIKEKFDVVTALACFEHIESDQLPAILEQLQSILSSNGIIIGTVPRPPAKPVLEFLSYRLGLIDPSQILDHKVYYNEKRLRKVAEEGGFELIRYSCFQFWMNSFFVLKPIQRRSTLGN